MENNYRRKSAQCLRSSGEVVQQQQFGRTSRVSGKLTYQKLPIRGSLPGERRCGNELKDTEVLWEQQNWRKYSEKQAQQKSSRSVEVGQHFVTKTAVLLFEIRVESAPILETNPKPNQKV